MIYIDPPYNTGNDFVYPDNFTEGLQTYLEFTGQVDRGGRKLQSNTETTGRYHANWLNMMYPRLYLAKNLMDDSGVIFVSIDDNEVHNLRILMNEVFGEENFLACIAWEKRYTRSNNAKGFYSLKDSILAFRRSDALSVVREPRTDKADEGYSNPDNDPRGPWATSSYVNPATKGERPNLVYDIVAPDGRIVSHPTHAWKYGREEHKRHVASSRLWWGLKSDAKFPRLKMYLSEAEKMVPIDLWDYQSTGTTDEGGIEVKNLFGGEEVFDNPKPSRLIERMLNICTDSSTRDIVLDFFAGSGTTGNASLNLNAKDGGNRRYILVQLPEPLDEPKTLDDGTRLTTIADICRERVRRAAREVREERASAIAERKTPLDTGFRAYKLAPSNFRPWNGAIPAGNVAQQLAIAADHINDGATDEALLAEVLLKIGFDLATPVAVEELAGKRVYNIDDGTVLACFDRAITLDLIEQMAARNPTEIICLDAGFPSDQTKVNAGQIIASHARDEASSIAFKVV